MSKTPSPLQGHAVALATALPAKHRLIVVLVLLAATVYLGGCAVDREKVDRTKADLEALCADPLTRAGQALCDRYMKTEPAPAPAPVE